MTGRDGAAAPRARPTPSLELVGARPAILGATDEPDSETLNGLEPHGIQNGLLAERIVSAERLSGIPRFLSSSQARLFALSDEYLTARQFIQKAQELLRSIVERESGDTSLTRCVSVFLHHLWAHEAEFRNLCHLCYVFEVLERVSGEIDFSHLPYPRDRLLKLLREIVDWYARRKTSLVILAEEGRASDEDNAIFGLHVDERQIHEGQEGIYVVFGFRCLGYAHKRLWARIYFRDGDRYLRGTSDWCERMGFGFSPRPVRNRVCSIVPITPPSQRSMIDRVKVFIPYAALELHPGKQHLEVVAEVTDSSHNLVASAQKIHSFLLDPMLPADEEVQALPLPPHVRALWSEDFGTRDGIENCSADILGSSLIVSGLLRVSALMPKKIIIECEALCRDGSSVVAVSGNSIDLQRSEIVLGVDAIGFGRLPIKFEFLGSPFIGTAKHSNEQDLPVDAQRNFGFELRVLSADKHEPLFGSWIPVARPDLI